jgi:chemotaxis protein methyltransferase CheR
MNPADYAFLSEFLLESSGLSLGHNKEYLLEGRLIPLAQSWGLAGIEELVQILKRGQDQRLSSAVTEAMTTNETSFFRDKSPFDDLKNHILPNLIEARKNIKTLRFWCAAASSGQESYSTIMLLQESFPDILQNWRLEFLATDISNTMLTRAEAGVYTQFEVQRGLPIQYLIKYFAQCPAGWQIHDSVRKRVTFRNQNLLENFHSLGKFDLIFCRNVLIYFENSVKQQILERMHTLMKPDSYLMMGAAETVLGITDKFSRYKKCASAVYTSAASPLGLKSLTG